MRAPHAPPPPPPLPSRIRKTISAYECLVIVCVCVWERERWLCLDVDFHTARQQPKIVTPVFQKQNHAQRSSSPLEGSLLSDTLHCACAPSSVCEGFFSLLLWQVLSSVVPVYPNSLGLEFYKPAINTITLGSRVRMELGMNMTFTLGFWVSFFHAWWILQGSNHTTLRRSPWALFTFFMNMQVSYGLCIVKRTWKFLEISSWQQCCKCCIKRLCAMCSVM